MKKHPFILLEVMIAFSLVALCATPLIVNPIRAYRAELQLQEEIECERLADWTFSEIQELLLKNRVLWESIPSKNEIAGPFPLMPETIAVPGRSPKKIARSYTLFGKGEKEGVAGEIYRLLYVKIKFGAAGHKDYTYRSIVQKIPKKEEKQDVQDSEQSSRQDV